MTADRLKKPSGSPAAPWPPHNGVRPGRRKQCRRRNPPLRRMGTGPPDRDAPAWRDPLECARGAGARLTANELGVRSGKSPPFTVKLPQPLPHAPDDPFREQFMKGMGYDAGMIAGRQQGRRNAPFQKILHLLGRGFLHASSGTAGSRLQHFLVRHARQHPVFPAKRFRIFRMHADYKTGIGKWRIPPGQRHAVDHYLIVLRGGGHDEAAGTHAEGMDAAVLDGGRHGITAAGSCSGASAPDSGGTGAHQQTPGDAQCAHPRQRISVPEPAPPPASCGTRPGHCAR